MNTRSLDEQTVETRKHWWLSSEVTRWLAISGLAALYGLVGYCGYLGENWIKEGHGKVTVIGIVMGLGLAGVFYLEDRAKRIGSVSARWQFAIASIVAGIAFFVLFVGATVMGAVVVAATLLLVVGPWLPSPYDFRDLLFKEPGLLTLAGVLLGMTLLAGASEFAFRRYYLMRAQPTEGSSPPDSAKPETTISVAGVVFLLSLAAICLMMFLAFAFVMGGRNAAVFPEGVRGIVAWLAQNHSVKWALPGCLVMLSAIAAVHFYRRARWNGATCTEPKLLNSVMTVTFTWCLVW
jgi:hypothetical protein